MKRQSKEVEEEDAEGLADRLDDEQSVFHRLVKGAMKSVQSSSST